VLKLFQGLEDQGLGIRVDKRALKLVFYRISPFCCLSERSATQWRTSMLRASDFVISTALFFLLWSEISHFIRNANVSGFVKDILVLNKSKN